MNGNRMGAMTLRIEHATVVCWREGRAVVLADQSITIADGLIRAIGPAGAAGLAAGPDGQLGEVIDASRHLVVPGLVNTHHHLFQSLTRGLKAVQDAPLFEWLTQLYQRWQHVSFDAMRDAAMISLAELMLSGATTTSDHAYLFPQGSDVRLEAVLEAAAELGIRIHACRGSMSVGQSKGGLPPDACVEDEDAILADSLRVVEQFHDPSPLSMRRIDLAPCAPFSVSRELLRDTAALGRERGLLLHTHAAETLDEQRYCLERFGVRPIGFLDDAGWLGPDVYLAHCVHLSDAEIDRFAETRTGVAHCPCSNMRLGSGIAPIRRMLDRGVKVGIGVDGSSSNDGGHLLAEARQALLLQRVSGGAEALRVVEAFRLVTLGGAAVLNRPALGNIEVGSAADLALFRADDVAFAGAIAQDPLAALMLCHAPRVDRLIVAGRTVVKGGCITGTDLPALVERFNARVAADFSH
ncbi:MAG: 8-oxoguanine deaminase [Phycisphaerae bacterium]|nr:8-oxoguanine deaminase [Phycisphaerae bacterium]